MSAYCKIFIKKQIIAIKNSTPTSNLTYANITSQETIWKSTFEILLSINPISVYYKKANKIIMKINNKNSDIAFSPQFLC